MTRRVVVPVSGPGRPDLSGIFGDLAAAMTAFAGDYDEHQARAIEDYLAKTIAVLREQTRRLSAEAADDGSGGG